MVLPAVALGLRGLIARLVRSSMLEVLRAEYIVTARSKGLREAPVIVRHALRNALIPLVTIVGLQIGNLLSGAVVVETVFARQGIGSMLIKGFVPLILFIAVVYIGINIAIDILHGVIDPGSAQEQEDDEHGHGAKVACWKRNRPVRPRG